MNHMRLVTAAAALLALAGCSGPGPARYGDLEFDASWQAWHDDPLPHLMVDFTNHGLGEISVGPGGAALSVSGPSGAVPVQWGDTPFARPILSSQDVVVAFHPRQDQAGRFMLSIDHAWGTPAQPVLGAYSVCVANTCTAAPLET